MSASKARKPAALSRQRLWQKNMVAAGRCSQCGKERDPELNIMCRACQDRMNEYKRRYRKRRKKLPM